jgi:cell division protein FtsA
MPLPPIAALEIGTTRTVVLIGETREDQRIFISGIGICPSTGVRKGQVVDLAAVRNSVQKAIQQAEETSSVKVWQVLMAVSGGHIHSMSNRGSLPLQTRDRIVTREAVEQVIELAKAAPLPQDCEVLHSIQQNFTLDDQGGVVRPEGMQASHLAVDMLLIYGGRNRLDNVVHVLRDQQLNVQDVVFSGLCAALAVLTPEQKRSGAAVIDLGGGTTNYLAYAGNVVATAGSLGVGGDHITNDIALAFKIPIARAEEIKRRDGSALLDPNSGQRRVALPQGQGFPERSISLRALHTVIHARAEETLRLVRSALDQAGVLPHLSAGVVLTGGGAYLRCMPELAQRVFGLPCSIGVPHTVDDLANVEAPAALATTAGLVNYGFRTSAESDALSPIRSWLKGVLKR